MYANELSISHSCSSNISAKRFSRQGAYISAKVRVMSVQKCPVCFQNSRSCSTCCTFKNLHFATYRNTLQHTARHNIAAAPAAFGRFIILQHTAAHCNRLQQTATQCSATQYNTQHSCSTCGIRALHHTATRCNTLQHAATRCYILQRTATHTSHCIRALFASSNIIGRRECGKIPQKEPYNHTTAL